MSDEAERLAAWCEMQAGFLESTAQAVDAPHRHMALEDLKRYRAIATRLRRPVHQVDVVALLRTPAPAPEGWRCVPVEPTPEMVKKGWASGDWRNLGEDDEAEPAAIWRAMLAASPAPPAHAELVGRLRDRAASMEDSDGMSSDTSILLTEAANALSPE